MLEIRYNTETGELTAWCGDEAQFGHLDRGWPTEAIAILNIPIPELPPEAYLYPADEDLLVIDPDYIPPADDTARVQELLSSSPTVITQPEMWELLRIFGRRLGY